MPVILTLSGNAAFVGKSEQTALQLLEKSVNETGGIRGRPVHFAIHDSESNAQQALVLTNAILAQKPAVILGSALAADCRAMTPLFKDGPVLYCLSPGIHPDPGGYVFASGASSQDFARTEITYFRSKGWKRLALMFANDATGQDAEAGIKADLELPENRSVQVVELQHFNTADLSVAAQLARIKAAKPDAMIAWVTGAPLGTILKGLQQVSLDIPFGTSDGNMSYGEMVQFAGVLPRQFYMGALQWIVHNDSGVSLDPTVVRKQNEFYTAYAQAGLRPDKSRISCMGSRICRHRCSTETRAGRDAGPNSQLPRAAENGGRERHARLPKRAAARARPFGDRGDALELGSQYVAGHQ